MDKPQVTEYKYEPGYCRNANDYGTAELKFKDGALLVLVPYRNWGQIEGFDSALLYKDGTLEALATGRPCRMPEPKEMGFWSKGNMSQQRLAEYLTVAAQVGNQVYADYDSGRTDETTWTNQFWGLWRIISESRRLRESLEKGNERVFKENPKRHLERI